METCSCYKVLTKTDVDEEDDDEDARSDEESLRVFLQTDDEVDSQRRCDHEARSYNTLVIRIDNTREQ